MSQQYVKADSTSELDKNAEKNKDEVVDKSPKEGAIGETSPKQNSKNNITTEQSPKAYESSPKNANDQSGINQNQPNENEQHEKQSNEQKPSSQNFDKDPLAQTNKGDNMNDQIGDAQLGASNGYENSQKLGEAGNNSPVHNNDYLQKDAPEEEPQRGEVLKNGSQSGRGQIQEGNNHDLNLQNIDSVKQNQGFEIRNEQSGQSNGGIQLNDAGAGKTHAQRVIEQNIKLKKELKFLAQATDDAILKEKRLRLSRKLRDNESEEYKSKKSLLHEQLQKIESVKHEIQLMKRQMNVTYNVQKVKQQEDRLRVAQKLLDERLEEKNSLIKIKREQHKALDFLGQEGEAEERIQKVHDELRKVKQDLRKENELYMENERELYKIHEKFRVADGRVTDIKNRIKKAKMEAERNKITKKKQPSKKLDVTKEDVSQMEVSLKDIKKKKEMAEKNAAMELKSIENRKRELRAENLKLMTYVKEKEKEIRLNNLRLKELRKLTRHNALRPLALDKKESISEIKKGERDTKMFFDANIQDDNREQVFKKD